VVENRVLGRIFGPNRDEETGKWKKLHNEDSHNLFSSPNIIRQIKSGRMRWAGYVACMGEERKVYRVLVGKPEGKRPLETLRRVIICCVMLNGSPSIYLQCLISFN
jgi:hypothetical protein